MLNQRESYQYYAFTQVASNYYPVTTAIAIRDESNGLQMTVMNSHTQGGSSLKQGRIELMQNRRISSQDNRGMGEPLDEVDEDGNGIHVPATYYVQIFNRKSTPSAQRSFQQRQERPPVTFFALNTSNESPISLQKHDFAEMLKSRGFTASMKYQLTPVAKNSILLRIENREDLFDGGALTFRTIDLLGFCDDLFRDANDAWLGKKYWMVKITEMSLTANQTLQDMFAKKIQWKT